MGCYPYLLHGGFSSLLLKMTYKSVSCSRFPTASNQSLFVAVGKEHDHTAFNHGTTPVNWDIAPTTLVVHPRETGTAAPSIEPSTSQITSHCCTDEWIFEDLHDWDVKKMLNQATKGSKGIDASSQVVTKSDNLS